MKYQIWQNTLESYLCIARVEANHDFTPSIFDFYSLKCEALSYYFRLWK